MDILIRQTSGVDSADAMFTDRAVDAAVLRIGSDPQQDLQLPGESILPVHCEISGGRKGAKLSAKRGADVSVNGKTSRQATLNIGDVLEIGSYRIEVGAAPSGFDLALMVSRLAKEEINYERAFRTDLSQTSLSPRLFGWVMSLGVIAFAMAIPLASHFASKTDVDVADTTASSRSLAWPVSDTLWTSGPLHEAHASLDNTCNACHVELFQKVTNESCENCHSDTQDHILAVADNNHLPIDMNGRCAACHREHNEPVSSLIITANALCTDCHAGHDLQSADAALSRVSGFANDTHPPFDVRLLKPPAGGSFDPVDEWLTERTLLAGAKENSQLKFDHKVHYDSERVSLNTGEILACAHCHEASVDGEHFEDIDFEINCANSGCHELELDPRNRLPHGQPDIAVAAIEGYYLRLFGNPDKQQERTSSRRRTDQSGRGSNVDCDGSAYECARERAARMIDRQFTKTGCVTCHTINDVGGEVSDRFQVAVVKLNEDYHPTARFDHVSHGIMVEPGSSRSYQGDAACIYCHDAPNSESSSDLLLPPIENCTTCHNGPERELNVPLGCIDCHAYHPAS